MGPATFRRLIAAHEGSAEAALAELPDIARAAGVERYRPCPEADARAELDAGRRAGARPLFLDHPDFPEALRAQDDAPPMLWLRGDGGLLARPAIGLVGARNASSLGLRMARALARGLGAAGYLSVSGLARGIDAAAHDASLETGTIAVLAGGVDVVYPPENAHLLAQIAEAGLVVSEMPPGLRPQARHFPRRNRIIAGLARALVVVEAAAKSGSLITAREAAEMGRDVLAVPGHPFDARAAGCNLLIRDGATLVRGAADVCAALGPGLARPAEARPAEARPAEARVADVRRGEGKRAEARRDGTGPANAGPAAAGHAGAGRPGGRAAESAARPAPEAGADATRGGRVWTVPEAPRSATGRPRARAADALQTPPGRPPRRAAPDGGAGPAPPNAATGASAPVRAADARAAILARLGAAPVDEDALLRDSGLARPAFAATLTELEMDGLVRRAPGGLLSREG